jgi:hypothetical protein
VAASSVTLDLKGAPGAVISARAVLDERELRTVLVIDGLARIEALGTAGSARFRITNASSALVRWSDASRGASGAVEPGDAFELELSGSPELGRVQLVAGGALAATLTLWAIESPTATHLLAQALVGG